MTSQVYIVSAVLLFIVVFLYKEFIKPALVFVIAIAIFLLTNILSPKEALGGFSNEQIAVIFLLLILSDVIKRSAALDRSVRRLFHPNLSYRAFLGRMSFSVAGASAFVNNTPLVALMLPYVYDWAKRKNISPSKVLMPLSMAAIVGGTVTLIGTSTNLVLSGLAVEAGLEPLRMFDFTPIGLPIMLTCCLYIIFFSAKVLPSRKDPLTEFREHPREYLVETRVPVGSSFIGKSLDDNKLRSLRGLYVVEIIRNQQLIAPVAPGEIILEGDILMFAGETETIIDLVDDQRDLVLADFADYPLKGKVDVVEVIISPNSSLIHQVVNKTNFRENFDAAIIAVDRHGEKMSGKVGEIELRSGDLLLLIAGQGFRRRTEATRDLVVVSKRREINASDRSKVKWILLSILLAFVLETTGVCSLFLSLLMITGGVALAGIIQVEDIKRSLDIELLVMLALALGVGKAIQNSGADAVFANSVLDLTRNLHPVMGLMLGIYLITNILTMFVTNAAAVAITFPVTLAICQQSGIADPAPYILLIAFAASADFVTPFGYQTNLMVFGPGGYRFADYIRFGILPTLIYMSLTIMGLAWWYELI